MPFKDSAIGSETNPEIFKGAGAPWNESLENTLTRKLRPESVLKQPKKVNTCHQVLSAGLQSPQMHTQWHMLPSSKNLCQAGCLHFIQSSDNLSRSRSLPSSFQMQKLRFQKPEVTFPKQPKADHAMRLDFQLWPG